MATEPDKMSEVSKRTGEQNDTFEASKEIGEQKTPRSDPWRVTRRGFLGGVVAAAASLAVPWKKVLAADAGGPEGSEYVAPPEEEQPAPPSEDKPAEDPPSVEAKKEPQTLKDYANALGREIGTSLALGQLNDIMLKEVVAREFNLFAVGWELLWFSSPDVALRPSRDRFNFKNLDRVVNYASQQGMKVQGHGLLWGNKFGFAPWLREGNFSSNELLEIARNHVQTMVSRYRGRVEVWEVVNEILGSPWDTGNSFWYDKLGIGHIDKVLRWAREVDPGAKLMINDYGIEIPSARLYIPDRDKFLYELIRNLKMGGAPIDVVGFQMHLVGTDFITPAQTDKMVSSLRSSILKYSSLGVDVHFTELDIRMDGVPGSQEERLQIQSHAYGSIVKTAIESGVKSITIFGVTDNQSWLSDPSSGGVQAAPLLFDANYQPKPAYNAVKQVFQDSYQLYASSPKP